MSSGSLIAPAAVLLIGSSALAQGRLAITEVCDGALTGSQPKWVELTNVGNAAITDLSAYSLGNINNGGTTASVDSIALGAVPLAIGGSYVVAYENSTNVLCGGGVTCFEFVYGFPADQYVGPSTNGDDAVVLFLGQAQGTGGGGPGDGSDAVIVDVYGNIGEDGSFTAWDYTDGYSQRCAVGPQGGTSAWVQCQWFVAGANVFDGTDAANHAALTDPGNWGPCSSGLVCTPASYCPQEPDLVGCTPALSSSPNLMPVQDGNDFTVVASGVPGIVNGLFFISLSGAQNLTSFPGGRLCIVPPLGRTAVQNSGGTNGVCDGTMSLLLNETGSPWNTNGNPGAEYWIQGYYRQGGGVSLTDGLYVEWQ